MPSYKPVLIGEGGENDNKAVRLSTRKREQIPNVMSHEYPPDQLREDLEKIKTDHPHVEVRSVTATYNCVGMVFATRRTWVEPAYVRAFLEDDAYRKLASLQEADIGDVVIYKDRRSEIQHVGIIAKRIEDLTTGTRSFIVLSKWGPWAEFFHAPDDIPSPWGTLEEVWTDRKL